MKKVAVPLVLFILLSATFAQVNKPQVAPLDSEFINYIEMVKKGEVKRFASEGYPLGYIPHPLKFETEVPVRLQKQVSLPEKYDLREEGKLTPVKDQKDCGCCWTFATYGSIESRWKILGLGEYNLSEQNLRNGHGFLLGYCEGGNARMATAYFSRGAGPISEVDDPYSVKDSTYISDLTPQAYISDARFLPNDINILKQIIYNYGAVYTDMFWDGSYYNSENYTYYCDADSSTNHAVLLVGWDDNKVTAGGKGAWIIRNSWGTGFGENGFFYISYNNLKVNANPAFWPNYVDYNPNATVYYYDKLGCVTSFGWVDNTLKKPDYEDYGLVKFVISTDQKITKLGTWVHSSNSTVNFYVYDDFNGSSLSNLLGSTGDQVCDYAGYYTFDLPDPIEVSGGNDIYIKVKYNTPENQYSIPAETFISDYADPVIETSKCWISSTGNNNSWLAIGGDTDYEYDLCIKAYGVSINAAIENDKNIVPEQILLYQNYPNPFNPVTTINYSLSTSQYVVLKVYDVLGCEVATLVDEYKKPGNYAVNFDATKLNSGIYFYQMRAGKNIQTRKLMVLK
ncbi:MAG TPA: C1 family peptidase [Candidatus Marinimicrobia bacterium]|nr:C1 family peptidase [Candidatus Neomarinimicrobiota bacterium]HRS51569.1 C1 family peptidase [Candidatus Neomarinimicrobiota bacterium]HRU92353.1 C1 family peptidase [Candidatus Neomarinimicrobiota bacterium]